MGEVKGFYRKTWTNSAAANLQRQIPFIAHTFPEIQSSFPATINVRFEQKIIVAGSDHRTPPIRWDSHTAEVFDFVRVRLAFQGLPDRINALMYVPHRSSHRNDPHKHEFLGERFVNGLSDGMLVTMEFDRQAIVLPYEDQTAGGGSLKEPRLARTTVIF